MDLGTYRNGFDCRMLSSVKSARVGSSTSSSSDIPPLLQCLPLENITLENQKYPPSVELKKVLGVPLENTLEYHHFGVGHSKPTPPLATEKLKKFKDSVQDTSNKARDRAKLLQRSIFILDRYEEDLTSTKRQRTDILFNENLGQANILKMGGQVISNPHAYPPEKLEAKTKSNDLEMNKRLRTSMLDARADGWSADVPRQPIIVEKDRDMVRTVVGNAIHIEDKIPRLPTGGVGWDRKMKRKRSFGAAGNRAISGESGDRDIKQAIHVKPSAEPKLQPIEAQGCSRSGRLPSKKPMVHKTSIHFGNMLNSGSPDHSGELDDDHEELLVASTSARNASYRACSNSFWKKMDCYFASFTSQDESYLKHQLNFVEELRGSFYQMPQDEKNALGDPMLKQDSICSGGGTESHANQESVKTGGGFGMSKTFDKASPLYQRILSALIEEDEREELNLQNEVINNFQCASADSHCGSCNYNDFEPKDRDRMESQVESEVDLRTQKQGLIDRISCDKSVSPNTDSNRSVSSSVCNNEPWQADDGLSYSDAGLVPLVFQSDLGFSHSLKVNASPISSSNNQYQMLSLDDRLLMELQCIGLCPETMPHLAEAEEAIDQDISELQAGLVQQAQKMKKTLGKIHEAIPYVKDAERRNMEQVAMSKLIEMAYKRRMVSRGSHSSKRVVHRVSNQVAFSFAERTLSRCRKFEDTGKSCFSEAPLQDIIFSAPLYSSDLNSVDCVVSRTASNRYKRSRNHTSDLRGSGSLSKQQYVSNLHEPILNKRKKREVLLNDVASSRAEDQNVKMLTNNSVSGNVNPSVDTFTSVRKSKAKSKQKRSYVLASGAELQSGCTEAAHPASTSACASSLSRTIVANVMNKKSKLSKEEKEKEKEKDLADSSTEKLTELGSFENEDYSSLLDFDEDGLQDQDLLGLEIPMDNLSDVHMFI